MNLKEYIERNIRMIERASDKKRVFRIFIPFRIKKMEVIFTDDYDYIYKDDIERGIKSENYEKDLEGKRKIKVKFMMFECIKDSKNEAIDLFMKLGHRYENSEVISPIYGMPKNLDKFDENIDLRFHQVGERREYFGEIMLSDVVNKILDEMLSKSKNE